MKFFQSWNLSFKRVALHQSWKETDVISDIASDIAYGVYSFLDL